MHNPCRSCSLLLVKATLRIEMLREQFTGQSIARGPWARDDDGESSEGWKGEDSLAAGKAAGLVLHRARHVRRDAGR